MNRYNYKEGDTVGTSIFLHYVPCPETRKNKITFARFVCECGDEYECSVQKVKGRGDRCQKCAKANLEKIGQLNKSHGKSGDKEYHCWRGIKERCYNNNCKEYPFYGGRGIKMHDGWVNNFQAFLDYVGDAPTKKHSMERINNNGDYEPSNVKWATMQTQCRNRRTSYMVEFKGEKINIRDLADRYGMKPFLVYERVKGFGWDLEEALTTPVNFKQIVILDINTGVFYESLTEASKISGVCRNTLSKYIHNPSLNKTSLISV